jgi:hypothetical protein
MMATGIMWTLTPDYIAQVKEELKGRRAAIEARIADDQKAIEAELAEIEQLEKLAYAIAVKRLPELAPTSPVDEAPIDLASLEATPEAVAEEMLEPAAAEPISDHFASKAQGESKGELSRLVRLDT